MWAHFEEESRHIEGDYTNEVEDLNLGMDDNLDEEDEIDHDVDFEVDVEKCKRKQQKIPLS